MIIEFFKHVLSPTPKWIKKLGFLAEAIAIDERYKRCKSNWQPHITDTKNVIFSEAKKLPQGARIMVIGAGGLHDLPYKRLSQHNYRLELVDIVFLVPAREKIKGFSNITLIEKDITNYAKTFAHWLKSRSGDCPSPSKPPQIDEISSQKPDLIISLNILSQLAIQFEELAYKKSPELDFSHHELALMEQHINWLKNQACPVLLVADIERQTFDGEQIKNIEHIAIIGQLGEPMKTWNWDISPKGEAHKTLSWRHKVGVWLFNS
jgi:hypothetical protein